MQLQVIQSTKWNQILDAMEEKLEYDSALFVCECGGYAIYGDHIFFLDSCVILI